MKSLINLRAGILVLMLLLLSGVPARADVDEFVLSVRNVTHSVNTIEFDLYLLDDDGSQTFDFAALQMGLLLNSSIYGNGTLTVSYDNTDSELDGDQQFVNDPDVVALLADYEGRTLIRLMPNNIPPVPPGAGSGTVISATGDGTFLARFTISSSQEFAPNSRAGLEFCAGDAVSPLYPTVVYSYIDGTSTPLGVTAGVDDIVDDDPLLNPTLPAVFNVTGGGSYCEGGDGLPVGLDGSELNTNYDLLLDETVVATEPGTGAAISFGNQTAGTYTVIGTNVAGDTTMTGQAEISETPNNTITLTSGAGTDNQSVCINSAITTITYSTSGATGATFSNLPDGVDGIWAGDVATISGTPTATGTSNYTIELTGGCGSASATGLITVNAIPEITNTTPGERCGPGQVTLGATASAGTINWYSVSTGGTSLGTGPSFTTASISMTTTYYVDATDNGCTTETRTPVQATVNPLPGDAGAITGPALFTPGSSGITYSVAPITAATAYHWSYSGTGVTINGSDESVTLDFSVDATSGTLSVYASNSCGDGAVSSLDISPGIKSLTLTSILLEGLYNGSGTMKQAWNELGPQWPDGIADHINVELHSSSDYNVLIYSETDVELTTDGTAILEIPSEYSGSYYITIKHRNSIETISALPVSFSGNTINYSFEDKEYVYEENLALSLDGFYLVYGGEVSGDGSVDTGDYTPVVNAVSQYLRGYLITDVDGNGSVDTGDYSILVNNAARYIRARRPQ
jgi:hypothetical protein